MEKSFNWKIVTTICLLLLACLVGVAFFMDASSPENTEQKENDECFLTLLPVEDEVCLVNDVVIQYLKGAASASALYQEYRQLGRLDYPLPLTIGFYVNNMPTGVEIIHQQVYIFQNGENNGAICVDIPLNKNKIDIFNLETNVQYEYRVCVILSNGQTVEASSRFKTAVSPRYIFIDGIRNVRDIGGYQLSSGVQIKQGMIYRGTELDGAISQGKYIITDAGVQTMVDSLGIKHQMDLRASNLTNSKDSLPSNVSHKYYSTYSYSSLFEHGTKSIRKIFEDLSNETLYPMYIHCTYGQDRTGTIVYLIGAVLGMSEEDLWREWELSVLFAGGASFENDMKMFIQTLKTYEGNTIQENVICYLKSVGVTDEQIKSLQDIMIEK